MERVRDWKRWRERARLKGRVPSAGSRRLHPDAGRRTEMAAGYAAFLDALTDRGWLDSRTAAHARSRAGA